MSNVIETHADYLSPLCNQLLGLQQAIEGFEEDAIEKLAPINFRPPPGDSASAQFYGCVSWAYIALWERGSTSFRFLIERAKILGLDQDFRLQGTYRAVHSLRTLFQHELDPTHRRDWEILTYASEWMARSCGEIERPNHFFWPNDPAGWEKLRVSLAAELEFLLNACTIVVKRISSDESRKSTVAEWALRCSRNLPPHIFDQIIGKVVARYNMPPFDSFKVRSVHLGKWNDRLRLLHENANLLVDAEKLVTATLLEESKSFCPLTGDDIIAHFRLPPGREVGLLLKRARLIWQASPCSESELLTLLGTQAGPAEPSQRRAEDVRP